MQKRVDIVRNMHKCNIMLNLANQIQRKLNLSFIFPFEKDLIEYKFYKTIYILIE